MPTIRVAGLDAGDIELRGRGGIGGITWGDRAAFALGVRLTLSTTSTGVGIWRGSSFRPSCLSIGSATVNAFGGRAGFIGS